MRCLTRWITILIVMLSGCAYYNNENRLSSIQLVDRQGFKEIISAPERLKNYQSANFLGPQPYERVLRVYARNMEGKTPSKLTTYHNNGELWQYLEVVNGRAYGKYREWHENGMLRLELTLIEGLGDLSEEAQLSWVCDGASRAIDAQGNVQAEIYYEKGKRQGPALYFYPNGQLRKKIFYEDDLEDGEVLYYDLDGIVIGRIPYVLGKREGLATFEGDNERPPHSEEYRDGLVVEAVYYDFSGDVIARIEKGSGRQAVFENGKLASVREYTGGRPEGEVSKYDDRGNLENVYHIKDGMKHGEEWIYYPWMEEGRGLQAKLCIQWHNDLIQGTTKSWYPNGTLEHERQMYDNCKHGTMCAWYQDGSLMMVEEYEHDRLCQGSYMRRGEATPISSVVDGEGIAMLYDAEGVFIKKVPYKKGCPLNED